MSPLVWIVLGFVAGFIASKVVNNTGHGLLVDILLGVVGAVAGGFLFNQFGAPGASGLNLYSPVVAVVGAIPILWLYHASQDAARSPDPAQPSMPVTIPPFAVCLRENRRCAKDPIPPDSL